MGLLTSVNNLNYTLQEKEKERKRKELERFKKESERRHKEEEKENINYIKSKISNFLRIEFQKELYMNSINVYEFYNINKKEFLFYKFYNNLAMKENIKMDYKLFMLDFFNSNYYKILKQVEAEAKKNEEYKIYAQLTTPKKEKYQQETPAQPIKKANHIDFNKINKVINIIFTIILIVLFFPIAILIAACKNQK